MSTVPELFEANLAALTSVSPDVGRRVRRAATSDAVGVVTAANGEPVLTLHGRALDSRRSPSAVAERTVSALGAGAVVVLGFGTGYLPEACLRRGLRVATIVAATPEPLAAAMRVRDLSGLLSTVPVVLLDELQDPVRLAALRLAGEQVVSDGPTVSLWPDLAALARSWADIPVSPRAPRVLVAGPIYGGSLPLTESVVSACRGLNVETRYFDASPHAASYRAFASLAPSKGATTIWQRGLVDLLEDALVRVAVAWQADLVLALAQAPLGPPGLARLKDAGVTTAFWFVENSRVLPYWRSVAPHYDWFYAIQAGRFLERLIDAGAPRPRYLPVACNPEWHAPSRLTTGEAARYGAPVSFAGSPYLNRRRTFAALLDCGVRIWGPGWDQPPLAAAVAEGGRRFSADEVAKIAAATTINLNLHSAEHVSGLDPDPDYVNPRTFELAACQAFQLVDARTPLPDLFSADEVATFHSVAELRALVAHYLARAEERGAMADRARRRALSDHTYRHRVRTILRDTLAPSLVARAEHGAPAPTLAATLARLEDGSATLSTEEAVLRIVREIELEWAA